MPKERLSTLQPVPMTPAHFKTSSRGRLQSFPEQPSSSEHGGTTTTKPKTYSTSAHSSPNSPFSLAESSQSTSSSMSETITLPYGRTKKSTTAPSKMLSPRSSVAWAPYGANAKWDSSTVESKNPFSVTCLFMVCIVALSCRFSISPISTRNMILSGTGKWM